MNKILAATTVSILMVTAALFASKVEYTSNEFCYIFTYTNHTYLSCDIPTEKEMVSAELARAKSELQRRLDEADLELGRAKAEFSEAELYIASLRKEVEDDLEKKELRKKLEMENEKFNDVTLENLRSIDTIFNQMEEISQGSR